MASRGRSLALLVLLQVTAWISASQGWFQVTMAPNDDSVLLKSFDGFSAFAFISPLLLVTLASFIVGLLSKATVRSIAFALAAISQVILTIVSGIKVAASDLSGVAKQIEAATGIAMSHGISDVTIALQPAAFIALLTFALLGLNLFVAAFASRKWATKQRTDAPKSAKNSPRDPISLWDQQR